MKTQFWQKINIQPIFWIYWKRPSVTSDRFSYIQHSVVLWYGVKPLLSLLLVFEELSIIVTGAQTFSNS